MANARRVGVSMQHGIAPRLAKSGWDSDQLAIEETLGIDCVDFTRLKGLYLIPNPFLHESHFKRGHDEIYQRVIIYVILYK
jgi:hypothetical protein